jgi:hypothetical protein
VAGLRAIQDANVLFAVEASRQWASDGIFTNAVHPGGITATNLSRHLEPSTLSRIRSSGTFTDKTLQQGAATSVLVATSPFLDGVGGRYFEDCNETMRLDPSAPDTTPSGVAPSPWTQRRRPGCGRSLSISSATEPAASGRGVV